MSSVVIAGDTSGSITLQAPAVAGTTVISLPAESGTVLNDATCGVCRAWVNFNGAGTVAIRASFNVSSITDNGVGDYTVNFTTAMPDANYCVVGTATKNNTDYDGKFVQYSDSASLLTSTRVSCDNASTGTIDRADALLMQVAIFR